jgi:hypothetical protein
MGNFLPVSHIRFDLIDRQLHTHLRQSRRTLIIGNKGTVDKMNSNELVSRRT